MFWKSHAVLRSTIHTESKIVHVRKDHFNGVSRDTVLHGFFFDFQCNHLHFHFLCICNLKVISCNEQVLLSEPALSMGCLYWKCSLLAVSFVTKCYCAPMLISNGGGADLKSRC